MALKSTKKKEVRKRGRPKGLKPTVKEQVLRLEAELAQGLKSNPKKYPDFEKGNKTAKGREEGSRNEVLREFDLAIQARSTELLDNMIKLALNGSESHSLFFAKRLYPAQRFVSLPYDDFDTLEKLDAYSANLLNKVGLGELTLEDAESFMNLLEFKKEIILAAQIEPKLRSLTQIVEMKR